MPLSLEAGYANQRAALAGNACYGGAWKLGGTTEMTRAVFGVTRPYFGVLHASEIAIDPIVMPALPLIELKAEAELCLRLGPKVDSLADQDWHILDNVDPITLFDAWCWGLEFPASPITNLADCGVAALVADRCAAGALALTQMRPLTGDWPRDKLIIRQGNKDLATGDISALLDPPDVIGHMFLQEAVANGFDPRAGEWVATGGLTPCVQLTEGRGAQLVAGEAVVMDLMIRRFPA